MIPDIREFLWNFVKPNAVAAIERDVLLASSINITGEPNNVATWCVLAKFVYPPNPS